MTQQNHDFLIRNRHVYELFAAGDGVMNFSHYEFNRIMVEEFDARYPKLMSGESSRMVAMVLELYKRFDAWLTEGGKITPESKFGVQPMQSVQFIEFKREESRY